jgi:hypothetical protein
MNHMLMEFQKKRSGMKKLLIAALLFLAPAFSLAGRIDLGVDYQGWSTNYLLTYGGWELLAPFSLSFDLDKGIKVYGISEYTSGHYTMNNQTTDLSGVSDTVLGADLHFTSFNLPAILNVAVNLPTGDPAWESKQQLGNIPTQFVDSRYRGRGFGINALYGLSFPMGTGQISAAAGYMYSAAFNPNYDLLPFTGPLKLSDTMFLALNQFQPFKDGQSQVFRLSGYYFMATQENGVDSFRMGPNVNLSYSWNNPSALSIDLGAQYFFKSQRPAVSGGLGTEPQAYYAPRFYAVPSYVFGQVAVGLVFKYILPNNYAATDAFYNGGGLLMGLQPSWTVPLDGVSSLRFSGVFDNIISHNEGIDQNGNLADTYYYRWSFGTNYEIKI